MGPETQTDTVKQEGPWKDPEGMHGRDGALRLLEFRDLPQEVVR